MIFVDAEFEALYEKYEKKGRQSWTILAQKLWYVFLEAQIETGGSITMVYKVSKSTPFISLSFDDY